MNNVNEQWVLDNALHNDISVIETVFFPQFKDSLTVKTAPTICGYQTPVYHQQPVTFDEWKQSRYKELRDSKYPKIAEQLDYIYHNGVDAWKEEMIDPIKMRFPKNGA